MTLWIFEGTLRILMIVEGYIWNSPKKKLVGDTYYFFHQINKEKGYMAEDRLGRIKRTRIELFDLNQWGENLHFL